jgi:hypothetical protein
MPVLAYGMPIAEVLSRRQDPSGVILATLFATRVCGRAQVRDARCTRAIISRVAPLLILHTFLPAHDKCTGPPVSPAILPAIDSQQLRLSFASQERTSQHHSMS